MRKIIFLKDQSGAALVIALIILIIITLMGLAAIFTSTFEVMLSGNKRGATDAFYSADSGIQVVVANLDNFNTNDPEKYVDNKYNPNTYPTNASVTIVYLGIHNPPRGSGESANDEYEYFRIQSTGQDQLEQNPIKGKCEIHEMVIKRITGPDVAGGN